MHVKPHPAVAKINAKIQEFHALEADFQNDQTLKLAQAALESAKAAAVAAEAEEDSIDPEELVDRRMEARRQVEISEIRLGRAQKSMKSRGFDVKQPLREGGEIAAKALRASAEPFCERLESELKRILGEDFPINAGHLKVTIYRKGERLFAQARAVESSPDPQTLGQAIALLEDVARFG